MRHPPNSNPVKFHSDKIFVRLARMRHSRKMTAIGFVLLLTICSMLWVGCMNYDNSIQYLKVTGSCNQQASISLIDESDKSVEKDSIPDLYKVRRKLFKQYAVNISKYLFAKIDGMGQCQGGWNGNPEVNLVFVYRPLIGVIKFDSDDRFDRTKSQDGRILDSPWVKMTIEKSSKLVVRAVFFWNERQFLFDQAVLASVPPAAATQPLMPLTLKVYGSYYEDYFKSVFSRSQDWLDGKLSDENYKLAKSKSRLSVSKRIPVDIMWLLDDFKWTSERRMIEKDLDKVFKQYENQYYDLTKLLLNTRFASLQNEQQYQSIINLKPIFDTNKYRYTSD